MLQDRRAFLLDRARINRQLIDDDIAFLQRFTHQARCVEHRAKIRLPRFIDRGRNRHDEKIGGAQSIRVAGKPQRRMLEVRRLDFPRAILSALKLPDTRGIDVETRDRKTFARKGDRDRQPYIAQSDDCDLPRR